MNMWSLAKTVESSGDLSSSLSAMMGRHTINNHQTNSPNNNNHNHNNHSPSHGLMNNGSSNSRKKDLPPLFWYMETGDWEKANDRVRRHPKEVKVWASLRTKNNNTISEGEASTNTTKRLALHHACFKLRAAGAMPPSAIDDPFVEVCRFILVLIKLYPEAAQKRESRHGCLPLHLASFASCAPRDEDMPNNGTVNNILQKPNAVSKRSSSESTTDTQQTNMSAVHAEEIFTGAMMNRNSHNAPNVSVSMRRNVISAKREEMLVQVINALLDAFPKAARVDSEGGRLPLHTACAGRATPRVMETLITAYPAAARQRNKDGFLPLHLAAHWGVSHISVAILLLKVYPDATVGRNRWERTPLEEALCMAGENGRPHQAALVRALRKHPSWWTRPQVADLILNTNKRTSNIVDVDETLPSIDGSTMVEQLRMHKQRQMEKYEEDEDDIVSYQMGEEVEFQPSPPPTPPGLMKRLSPMGLLGKNKKMSLDSPSSGSGGAISDPLGVGVSLAHLIYKRQWNSVIARIRQEPMEAEQSLQVMTRGGFMASTGMSPLHYACERKPPAEVVKRLIECFPFAVMTRAMPGGCLPLHIACTWGASPEDVQALLAADAGSVRVKDELGNVALHSACFSGADSRVVEALLQADGGKSVLARNHQGSRPIDICKRLRHENRIEVMGMLNLVKEDILKVHGRSRSSGFLSEIAKEAEEMNRKHGTPSSRKSGGLEHPSLGVEVTYSGDRDDDDNNNNERNDDLVWI